jgi:hypothetical protein
MVARLCGLPESPMTSSFIIAESTINRALARCALLPLSALVKLREKSCADFIDRGGPIVDFREHVGDGCRLIGSGLCSVMTWTVEFHAAFDDEFAKLSRGVRVEIAAGATLLSERGPTLGRPHVDTLKGSKHANMKELRFRAEDGVWRVAFAFDPERRAVILVAGDKSGVSQKRFYRSLVGTADSRFGDWLKQLQQRGS